jgi:hypothetical protein
MDVGTLEPFFPQTQLFSTQESGLFYLTFEAWNEYFPEGDIRNKIFWQEVVPEGSRSGVLTLSLENNFVEDVEYIASVTVITKNKDDNPWQIYVGYKTKSGIGLAGCNLSFSDNILQIKTKDDCKKYNLPEDVSSSVSLKIADYTLFSDGQSLGSLFFFKNLDQNIQGTNCEIDFNEIDFNNCSSQKFSQSIEGQMFLNM